jgi:hypothetical protein
MRPHLQPWGLLGYVTGFQGRHSLEAFEKNWQDIVEGEQIRLVGYRPTERLKNAQFFGFGPITWLNSLDDDASIHMSCLLTESR